MRLPKRNQRAGFTLTELMIVVAIIGLLSAVAVPNFVKSRTLAQNKICIENLAQIESAKQIWGLENGKKNGDRPTDADLFGTTQYIKVKPECPLGGNYDLTTIGENATCTMPGHVL